jgi:hypothetical protein
VRGTGVSERGYEMSKEGENKCQDLLFRGY